MTTAYASSEEYATYRDETQEDVSRLLARASELLDSKVRATFNVGDDDLPTNTTIAEALRDACCAQVEYWLEAVGEEHDLEGMGSKQVAIGHLRMDELPPELAPRAFRFLDNAGLMTPVPITGQTLDDHLAQVTT